MKTILPILALLLVSQDYDPIHDVFYKHEKAIRRIPGVRNLSVGGVSGSLRIIVQIDDDAARAAVLAYTGEKLEGFPVHVLGGGASAPKEAACARCPVHCAGPGRTVAAPT